MPVKNGDEEYLTTQEAIEFLGVSESSLTHYVQKGKIKRYWRELGKNVKFYKMSELRKLIEFHPEDKP